MDIKLIGKYSKCCGGMYLCVEKEGKKYFVEWDNPHGEDDFVTTLRLIEPEKNFLVGINDNEKLFETLIEGFEKSGMKQVERDPRTYKVTVS